MYINSCSFYKIEIKSVSTNVRYCNGMVNIICNLQNGNGYLNDKRVTRSSYVAFNFCEWNNDIFVIKNIIICSYHFYLSYKNIRIWAV